MSTSPSTSHAAPHHHTNLLFVVSGMYGTSAIMTQNRKATAVAMRGTQSAQGLMRVGFRFAL